MSTVGCEPSAAIQCCNTVGHTLRHCCHIVEHTLRNCCHMVATLYATVATLWATHYCTVATLWGTHYGTVATWRDTLYGTLLPHYGEYITPQNGTPNQNGKNNLLNSVNKYIYIKASSHCSDKGITLLLPN